MQRFANDANLQAEGQSYLQGSNYSFINLVAHGGSDSASPKNASLQAEGQSSPIDTVPHTIQHLT
jgi:hypothetical protein